jgi:hypothetical protein
MIKLVFNPFFDSHVYVDMMAKKSILGVKYVGEIEFINELRLRSGLTSIQVDEMERTISYLNAMREALATNDSKVEIFRPSFEKDELGVAITLLKWRDSIVELGWKPQDYTNSPKINALIDIEKKFKCEGGADNKRELLEKLELKSVTISDIAVESVLPYNLLPNYYKRLLEALKKIGVDVAYLGKPRPQAKEGTQLRLVQEYLLDNKRVDLSSLENDSSIEVCRFEHSDAVYRYAALSCPDVITSKNTMLLRQVFSAMNMPLPKTTSSTVTEVSKLLPLVLSLKTKTLYVNKLLAFLSISPNPISSYKVKKNEETFVSLNRVLSDLLLSNGGIDKDWNDILNGDLYDKNNNKIESTKNDTFLKLLMSITETDGKINKKTIDNILKSLISWSAKDMENRSSLLRYCQMAKLLVGDIEEIEVASILRWLGAIGAPTIQKTLSAEVGACYVADTPMSIVDTVDSLYWSDCWSNGKSVNKLDFLSPVDIAELGIEIDSGKDIFSAERYAYACGLSCVKDKLVLLTCNTENGEPVQEHPILIELKNCCKLKEVAPKELDKLKSVEVKGIPQKESVIQIDKERFSGIEKTKSEGGLRRDIESYSSINLLINYPFDYVLRYLLHWTQYGIESMSDMNTTKGNVAHEYIERLFKANNYDVDKSIKMHNTKYSEMVEQCVLEKGCIMYLEANRIEYMSFIETLKLSVYSLLMFIKTNNLKVDGTEAEYTVEFSEIGKITAKIDLLLSNDKGEKIIVDMKWNEGKTYQKKLENGTALQLMLYKKVLEKEGNKVSLVGFYVLPQRKFLTSSKNLPTSEIVEQIGEEVDYDKDFTRVCNAYKYRINQIKEGTIDNADGLEMADIQYHKDMATMNLYPLEKDYNNDALKNKPYGNVYKILKGDLQ